MYYHGRSKSRPYHGKHIYITSSLGYAALYTDSGYAFEVELTFSLDKVFSLQNSSHIELIKNQFGPSILDKLDLSGELDWSEMNYLSDSKFDTAEEWLQQLGFKAIRLKERTNVESIYVFNNEDVVLGNKVSI
jgi:hypothetical protein